jgi:flavin reductase (DIM6/NTAB) family NADH-FMN oxidoreductase RutF
MKQVVEAGDHHIVIAEVVNGNLMHPDNEPSTHVRANGFQY